MTGADGRRIVLVAAVARNGVIGHRGAIPWHLPEDFAHFREVTTGHVLLMGRATYESIGRPLPGRPNIVLTADPDWSAPGVEVAHSLSEGLALAAAHGIDIAVIGGATIYEALLPYATDQIISEVHAEPEGDTFYPGYPDIDRAQWREVRRLPGALFDRVWWSRR